MDPTFDYKNSKVPESPHFEAIMKKYDVIGREISIAKFHRDYVAPLDDTITLRQWKYFIDRFKKHVNKRIHQSAKRALKISEDTALSEAQMEAKSMRKILAIAEMTLSELTEQPELLAEIPIKDRMNWMFGAMKARDSRTNVNLKKLTETRKTNMYEDMMQGAQYGAIDADAIEDPADPPKKLVEGAPGVTIPINKETREFKPEELE